MKIPKQKILTAFAVLFFSQSAGVCLWAENARVVDVPAQIEPLSASPENSFQASEDLSAGVGQSLELSPSLSVPDSIVSQGVLPIAQSPSQAAISEKVNNLGIGQVSSLGVSTVLTPQEIKTPGVISKTEVPSAVLRTSVGTSQNPNAEKTLSTIVLGDGDAVAQNLGMFFDQSTLAPALRENGLGLSVDTGGSQMRAALQKLEGSPTHREISLDFNPSPESLKEIARANQKSPLKINLYRMRETGRWVLVKVGSEKSPVEFADYDRAFLGAGDSQGVGLKLPLPKDLISSSGKNARFFLLSEKGVTEWNSHLPYPKNPKNLLGRVEKSLNDGSAWLKEFYGNQLQKWAMKIHSFFYAQRLKSSGIAVAHKKWNEVSQEWLAHGAAPQTSRLLIHHYLPEIIKDEIQKIGPRMAPENLSFEEQAGVLAFTVFQHIHLYSPFTSDITPIPEGDTDSKGRIRLNLKLRWRHYPSLENHFRTLFFHEYIHRLQVSGVLGRDYGVEPPAVAAHILRAIELEGGLKPLREGRIESMVSPNELNNFDRGMKWAQDKNDGSDVFYSKGSAAGAAYEIAQKTGRWEDSWEFLRRIFSKENPENPRVVADSILNRSSISQNAH